jgi:hypothetical protein
MLPEEKAARERLELRTRLARWLGETNRQQLAGRELCPQHSTALVNVFLIQRVQDFLPRAPAVDQPFVLEDFEMVRDRRLGGMFERGDDVIHTQFALLLQQLEYFLSRGVA